jgi:hypothetical protein
MSWRASKAEATYEVPSAKGNKQIPTHPAEGGFHGVPWEGRRDPDDVVPVELYCPCEVPAADESVLDAMSRAVADYLYVRGDKSSLKGLWPDVKFKPRNLNI